MKKRPALSLKQILFACTFLAAFAGITLFLFLYHRDEKLFANITSQIFATDMKSSTLNMHYSLAHPSDFGIYDYEVLLPGYSAEAQLSGLAATENILSLLADIDQNRLSEQDAYTYQLLTRSLENSLQRNRYAYYEEPLAPSSGMQSQLPILLAEYAFRTKQDVEDYLALLDQTDEYFASLLMFEQEKAAAGLLMPASSLRKVIEQCDTIVSKEELASGNHFLQSTFQERLQPLINNGTITREKAAAYTSENERLLTTVMQPAYESLADGLFVLEDTSIPLTGLGAKPHGIEYYQYLLISETGSYRSIPDIQTLLTTRFQEEYQAIRTIATQHPEILELYSSVKSENFPYQEADVMLADLQRRMQGEFPAFPDSSSPAPGHGAELASTSLPAVSVKSVSPSLEQYCSPAFYLTAPIDDTDNNVIYINQKNSPTGLELYTTLAHEGYPGHLYQTVYSNRSFLQNRENNVRQLLWYGGYLEGWALYVEFRSFDYAADLMREHGHETQALCAEIEKHNRSLQLCLYSLLDIMIHYENASYSEVANVLENFGITNSASATAIYTYIAEEPCNYLKYYLGYLEILELQKLARKEWDTNYTDYAFHSFYLDCGPSDFTSLTERLQHTDAP
ncbi:MAG: DUF885 domain-containing protein [Lachnospiraceae bacterium]|nr:DUF885 domain-containing protein [Lachnospiraceae bacterium]